MSHFEDLKVWQKSVDLAVKIYEISVKENFSKTDFGLKDQMRRSAVSIGSNISEGDQVDSDRASIKYLRISKGSTAELYTQSVIAWKIGYMTADDYEYIRRECKEILSVLSKLVLFRSGKQM